MNIDYAFAFLGGCIVTGLVWLANREAGNPALRPVNNEDLRLLRLCGKCRCYLGDARTIQRGQHLSILHDICPRCARKSAVNVRETVAAV